MSAKHIIVSSLAIFFVDHVANYVALNSESESRLCVCVYVCGECMCVFGSNVTKTGSVRRFEAAANKKLRLCQLLLPQLPYSCQNFTICACRDEKLKIVTQQIYKRKRWNCTCFRQTHWECQKTWRKFICGVVAIRIAYTICCCVHNHAIVAASADVTVRWLIGRISTRDGKVKRKTFLRISRDKKKTKKKIRANHYIVVTLLFD